MVAAFPDPLAHAYSHRAAPHNGDGDVMHRRILPSAETLMSNDSGGSAAGDAIPSPLVGTMVPEQILHDDEVVLLLTKPSVLFIFYSSFPFLLGTLMLGVLAGQLTNTISFFTPASVSIMTVLVCLGRLIWALLVWTSHVYMLTNLRVVTIKGVVNVHMVQSQLRKIQKIEIYRPVGQRVLGTGTIGFATAAAAGSVDSTWVMVARPVETHEQIVAAINKSQSR